MVTDNGHGIPSSKLKLLFQPFERLGADRSVEGTGLGLMLSRALAEAMHGQIGVETEVDRGSTFWIELPESTGPLARQNMPHAWTSSAETPPVGRQGSVLYIEDNLSNVRLMQRILQQRAGIELEHASRGDEGLAKLASRKFDLVLLDLHLPDMSGEDVLRHLWEKPSTRQMPVLVLTADATPGLVRRLKAAGAAECLTKPLDIRRLLQVVDELLTRRTQNRANAS